MDKLTENQGHGKLWHRIEKQVLNTHIIEHDKVTKKEIAEVSKLHKRSRATEYVRPASLPRIIQKLWCMVTPFCRSQTVTFGEIISKICQYQLH